MSGNQSFKRRELSRVTMVTLALSSGLAMAMVGFLLAGSAEHDRVAIAAKSAETIALEIPMAAAIQRQSPRGTDSWRSGPETRREPLEALRGSEPSFGGQGDLRVYLLRSAAAAHRGAWLGEASTPEFS
jgi:hypothetical protein